MVIQNRLQADSITFLSPFAELSSFFYFKTLAKLTKCNNNKKEENSDNRKKGMVVVV